MKMRKKKKMKTKSIKTTIKKVINIVSYVFIGVLLALLLFVIISHFNGKIAFIGGRTVMWVKTGSMEPAIEEKSYILVKKVDASEVEVGDIITFISTDETIKGSYNTHRVVEVIGDHEEFVTKGDNNPGIDKDRVAASKVVAKVVRTMPLLTGFGRFLSEPIGIITILMIMFGTCVLVYLPDVKKTLEEIKEEKKQEKQKLMDQMIQEEVKKLEEENKKG